jgi:hypothetical protein
MFELQVHGILEFSHSKNDIHAFERIVRRYPGTHPKFQTLCSRNMATDLRTISK